ncbi:retrotransposable element Tf2 [Tanacetum coccineum]
MMEAPILGLPDFDQEFVIKTVASGTGTGAVLCQNGHPLAYLSKTLSTKQQALSTYEKEFMAVVAALEKWKGYLLDRHFKIKTDLFSLKYLLNQKLTTPFQLKWLPKLLRYDYEIVFKKGVDNVVANALSRVNQGAELLQTVFSSVASDVMDKIKASWQSDDTMRQLIKSLKDNSYKGRRWSIEKERQNYDQRFVYEKVKLKLSTAYHPQTEAVNRCLGCYLRYMCGEKPKEWVKWLSLAEFWYNTNFHSAINTTPYEAVYYQTPLIYVPYIPGDRRVENVDRTLQSREEVIKMLKFHMKRAQDRMENQANKHRTDREFEVGNWVYLKLQPHRQVTVKQGQQHKLFAKYYGPFFIEEKVGRVAYKLQLPNHSQIHTVFRISQLKKCHGKGQQMRSLPHLKEDGLLDYKPMAILEKGLGKVNNRLVMYVLIQWTNRTVEEATWEIYADVLTRFLDFDAA